MFRRYLILPLAILATVFATGCNFGGDQQQTNSEKADNEAVMMEDDLSQSQEVSVELVASKEMKEAEKAMPDPLNATEAAKYKADLDLKKRQELAKDLATIQPKNGFDQLKAMFPDLKKVKSVAGDAEINMMKMGSEDWYYSDEGNFTAVICVMVNTPVHIFDKKDPTDGEVTAAMKKIKGMKEEDKMEKNETEAKETENKMEVATPSNEETKMMSEDSPAYITYSDAVYNQLNGKKSFALFFHAEWCPLCRVLEKAITEDLATLPAGTKIVKVDYDNSAELKKKYGVSQQTTVVYIDASGELVGIDVNPTVKRLQTMLAKAME